ncbi:ABC transporter substrate-binding protein [Thermodesulfobacteriota bacterium]
MSLGILFLFGKIGIVYAENEVTIGIIAHLTGPYGPGTRGINEGAIDSIDAFNKFEPIRGVKLKSAWVDGASSPAKSISACKKMVSQHKPVMVIGWATPSALATKGYLIKKKIASVDGGGTDALWELPSWTFSAQAPYVNQLGGWVDFYLKNIWPKKGLKRAPNFAWVTWDNAAGRASITDKVKEYIKSKGVNIVPGDGEFFPIAPTEVGAQMMRLKKNKVDFTYGMMLFPTAAAVLKGMGKTDLIDQISPCIAIPDPIILVKQIGFLSRNTYFVNYFRPPNEWPQESPRILEIYKKKGRQNLPKLQYAAGFGWALPAAEAVKMAAMDVGSNNISGEACYNALKRMKKYDRWNVGVPVGFGEKKRFGADSMLLFRLKGDDVATAGVVKLPNLTKFQF